MFNLPANKVILLFLSQFIGEQEISKFKTLNVFLRNIMYEIKLLKIRKKQR